MIDSNRGFTLAGGGTRTPNLNAGVHKDRSDADTGDCGVVGTKIGRIRDRRPTETRSAIDIGSIKILGVKGVDFRWSDHP